MSESAIDAKVFAEYGATLVKRWLDAGVWIYETAPHGQRLLVHVVNGTATVYTHAGSIEP